MTRSEAAKRLGKSVAAVRRLEGVLLHPTRDARGVHHFDEGEIEALAESISLGDVSIWQELQADAGTASALETSCPRCPDLEAEIGELREQLERQQSANAREVQRLQLERESERAQVASERRKLDRELRELIVAIEAE